MGKLNKTITLITTLAMVALVGCAPVKPQAQEAVAQEQPAVVQEQSTITPIPTQTRKYEIVDSHLHYLDFLQKSDGFESLVKEMDKSNVSQAVIFGMPMKKQWDEKAGKEPAYYMSNDSRAYYFSATDYIMMEALEKQPKEIQDRFLPFIGGVNPNDKSSAALIRQALETYPGRFVGIGEVMSKHDDLTALTYGETPHANSEAMLAIYDLAAEKKMPVLIHHNIAGSNMDDPIYLEEMEKALAHNRNTNIIWAHVGISRRVEISNLIELTEQSLIKNKNLYYDISWVVYDDYINKSEESLKQWAALIEKYPDRFSIGSDVVGHWEKYEKEITKYYPLVDLLSKETAEKLCKSNILNLIAKPQEQAEKIPA